MCSDRMKLAKTYRRRMQGNQYTYGLSKQTYDIMVFNYVSTSMHAEVDTRGGQQFVEVVRQASHLIY